MIAHSALYEEAVRFSNTMSTIVDIYLGDTLTYPAIPVINGSVTSDRGSKVRWNSTAELALFPWDVAPLLDAYRARYKVFRGLTSLGRTEMLQLGEYRIDEINRSDLGHLELTGSGLESYAIDARFPTPRIPPKGQSTLAAINALIQEGVPATPTFRPMNTTNRKVTATAPWEKDRWDAVLSLGDSINADVYCNNAGIFVTRNKPALAVGVPVFLLNVGPRGVLLGEQIKNTRDGTYNAVSVIGQSTNQAQTPVYGFAANMNPASPTYYNGNFGRKPMFFSSQFIHTTAQANSVASTLLRQALAVNQALTVESLAICFLEAGDVVRIMLDDGTSQVHLLQKVTIGLSHDGKLSADTFVNQVEDVG